MSRMYNAGTATSLAFALALALSAGAVTIPSTPAVETFGGDLQFSVEEDRRVSIKYGDSKTVYIDDASETTVDAIKLGFGIGAHLDRLKDDIALAATLRSELKAAVDKAEATSQASFTGLDKKAAAALLSLTQKFTAIEDSLTEDLKAMQTSIAEISNDIAASASNVQKVIDDAKKDFADAIASSSSSVGVDAIPAWNSFSGVEASDQGGLVMLFTWPRIVNRLFFMTPDAPIYRAKFTRLDASGQKTTDIRWSEWVHCDEDRLLIFTVPKWQGEDGAMPPSAEWTVAVDVYEQSRLLPSPKGNVIAFIAQAPRLSVTPTIAIRGPKDKRTFFSVDLSLVYPYGANGYKELQLEVDTDNEGAVSDIAITGEPAQEKRKLNFAVTTDQKELAFKFNLKATSKATGLSVSTTISVAFRGGALEPTDGLLTDAQMTQLVNHMGADGLEFTRCFSSRVHGWNGVTMHNNCDRVNKKTLVVARRGSNMRVFGGYAPEGFHPSYRNMNNYIRSAAAGPWLFTIPNIGGGVEFLEKCCRDYRYYFHSNYAYTWGGGHDFYCDNSFTSCNANVHHDYNSNGRGYHTTASNAYLSGQYSWNFPSEGANSIYEVFVQL